MRLKAEDSRAAAFAAIDALGGAGRVMVVSFNRRVFAYGEPTNDRDRLRRVAYDLDKRTETRLYDALELVLEDRIDPGTQRTAVVLFTDGVDTASRLTDATGSLARVAASHTPIYAVQYDTAEDNRPRATSGSTTIRMPPPRVFPELPPPGAPPPDVARPREKPRPPFREVELEPRLIPAGAGDSRAVYARAAEYLRRITDASGGRLYHAGTLGDVDEVFLQVARELSEQYTLCYYPTNQARDGSYRRIRVEVDRPGVTVRARAGYRAVTAPRAP